MSKRWILTFVVAVAAASPVQADVMDAVYEDAREIIEQLIRTETGDAIASKVEERLPGIKGRYLQGTLDRLRTNFWGALQSQLQRDVIDMAADEIYWDLTMASPKFFECLRNNKQKGCELFVDEARPSSAEKLVKQSLVDSQCAKPNPQSLVACDIAQGVKARLLGNADAANSYMLDAYVDALLRSNASADHFSKSVSEFRRKVRGWMLAPDSFEAAQGKLSLWENVDEIAAELGADSVSGCDAQMLVGDLEKAPRECLLGRRVQWVEKAPAFSLAIGDKPAYTGGVEELLAAVRGAGNERITDVLVRRTSQRLCVDKEAKTLRDKAAVDAVQGELNAKTQERDELTKKLTELKTTIATMAQTTTDPQMAAQYEEGSKRAAALDDQIKALKSRTEPVAASVGLACEVGREAFTGRYALAFFGSAVPAEHTEELLQKVRAAALLRVNVTDALSGLCRSCQLNVGEQVAALKSLRKLNALFLVRTQASLEKLNLSPVDAVKWLRLQQGKDPEDLPLELDALEAMVERDFRRLGRSVVARAFSISSASTDEEKKYLRFFVNFSAYVLDDRGSQSERAITQEAFRASAYEVLSDLGKDGFPARRKFIDRLWLPTLSLRASFNQGYLEDQSRRYIATIDFPNFMYSFTDYFGGRLSLVDVLEPFMETALRDGETHYLKQGRLAASWIHPRCSVYLGIPQLTRHVVIETSVGWRAVVTEKAYQPEEGDPRQRYVWGTDLGNSIELSFAATYVF